MWLALFLLCFSFDKIYAKCLIEEASTYWNGESAGLANEEVVGALGEGSASCQEPLSHSCCVSGTCVCTPYLEACQEIVDPAGVFSTLSLNTCSDEGFYYGEFILKEDTIKPANFHTWFSKRDSVTYYKGFGTVDMGDVFKIYLFDHFYKNNYLDMETYNDPGCYYDGNIASNYIKEDFFSGSSVSPNVGVSKPPKTKTCSSNSTCLPVQCDGLGVRCCAADTGTCVCVPHQDAKYCENLDKIVTNSNTYSCQARDVDGKTVEEMFYYGEVAVKGYSKKNPLRSKLYEKDNAFTFRGAGSILNKGAIVTKLFYFYHYILSF